LSTTLLLKDKAMDKLVLLLLGSIVVLLQTAFLDNTSDFYHVWALGVSASSTILCVVLLVFLFCDKIPQDIMKFSTLLLTIIWIGGTSLMTMKAPYAVTGNGYFGAWIALLMAWLLAVDYFPALKGPMDSLVHQGGTIVALLTIASLTVFAQTVWNCLANDHWCHGEAVWIMICSGVSLAITALLHVPSVSGKIRENFKFVALFLVIWWMVGFFVATFDSPYVFTGNGFFGCWVAVIASAALVDNTWGLGASEKIGNSTKTVPRELLRITIGSLVTLVAATYHGYHNNFWGVWSVVCPAVSTGICVFLSLIMVLGAGDKVSSYMQLVSWFLLVWWIFGTGVMTFKGPFVGTGNGYFGAWLALLAAFMFCQAQSETLRGWIGRVGAHGHLLVGLIVASATVFVQPLIYAIDHDHRFENEIVAWICSVVSMVLCLLVAVLAPQDDVLKWIMLTLFALWAIGVGFLTFDGPYVFTSNAYFACWGALIISKMFVWRLFPNAVPRSCPQSSASSAEAAIGPVAAVVGVTIADNV
jgi:hypothetical protein